VFGDVGLHFELEDGGFIDGEFKVPAGRKSGGFGFNSRHGFLGFWVWVLEKIEEVLAGAVSGLFSEVVEVVGEAQKEGFFSLPKEAAFGAHDVISEGSANAREGVAIIGKTDSLGGVVEGGEGEGVGELFGAVRVAEKGEDSGGAGLALGDAFKRFGELVEFALVCGNIEGHF
jgi:hypothetical protein